MSNILLTQVRKMKIVHFPVENPLLTKYVLYSLADRANDEGSCWPSVSTICDELFIGRSTFFRKINELETLGFVKRVNRQRENGKGLTSNGYTIYLPEIILPAITPSVSETATPVPPRDYPRPATGLPPVPPRDTKHNSLSIKETNICNFSKKSEKVKVDAQIKDVFGHWQKEVKQPDWTLTDQRYKAIKRALVTGVIQRDKKTLEKSESPLTVEQIKGLITLHINDPWWISVNKLDLPSILTQIRMTDYVEGRLNKNSTNNKQNETLEKITRNL